VAFPLMELAGSVVFIAGGCIVKAVGLGSPKPEESGAAAASEGALEAAVLAVASFCCPAGFPRFTNMLLVETDAGGAEIPESAFDGVNRLGPDVAVVPESAGLEVDGGKKLREDFGSSEGCVVLGNMERRPDCALKLDAADCPPRFPKTDFGASALGCCASEGAGVAEEVAALELARLLKRPAVDCAAGPFAKMFELVLFDVAPDRTLIAGWDVEVFPLKSVG